MNLYRLKQPAFQLLQWASFYNHLFFAVGSPLCLISMAFLNDDIPC